MIRLSALTLAFCLSGMLPWSHAEAAEPAARCTKADYTRGRRTFQKLFDARQYPEAVALLQRTRESCSESVAKALKAIGREQGVQLEVKGPVLPDPKTVQLPGRLQDDYDEAIEH